VRVQGFSEGEVRNVCEGGSGEVNIWVLIGGYIDIAVTSAPLLAIIQSETQVRLDKGSFFIELPL
jgi:hypothetical protein